MKTLPDDALLKIAHDSIVLVLRRTELEIATHGATREMLHRIRDLRDALELIDPDNIVVDLLEHLV